MNEFIASARKENQLATEQKKLKAYQRYSKTILTYLYSYDKKFIEQRVTYQVHTIQGFIRYCKVIFVTARQFASIVEQD